MTAPIEPASEFHVGDWIIFNSPPYFGPYKIISINESCLKTVHFGNSIERPLPLWDWEVRLATDEEVAKAVAYRMGARD